MRILVFGDSITQGYHDEESGGWVNRLSSLVMAREVEQDFEYNKSIVNLGVSGDNTEDLLKRVASETDARILKYPTSDFDVALLAIGINDSQFEMATGENRISIEEFRANIKQLLSELSTRVKQVVFLGITPVVDERIQPMPWKETHGYSNEVIANYNQALQEIATEYSHLFIPAHDVYSDNEHCLPDGLHPNAEGHRLIFERVRDTLEAQGLL